MLFRLCRFYLRCQPAYQTRVTFEGFGGTGSSTPIWIKTAGIMAPLFISEFVKDIDKRVRYIRSAAVATALVPEGLYTSRVRRERDDCKEQR
jgi:hypothetical protein